MENKELEHEKISRKPFPGSQKIYVQSQTFPDVKVAMREIQLEKSESNFSITGKEHANPNIVVYDTSGPYTDPNKEVDIYKGIERIREKWILDRKDVEQLEGSS